MKREKNKTEERGLELLSAVNSAAMILLDMDIDSFEDALHQSTKVIAEVVGADRMYIWKNHTEDGELYCNQIHEWSEGASPQQGNEYTVDIRFSEVAPGLDSLLADGQCLNGIVREFTPELNKHLSGQDIVSVIIVPITISGAFWGFIGFDDCHNERVFTGQEEAILRSAGILFANAYQRNEMLGQIRDSSVALEDALGAANEANRVKTEFLAKMSHEIRTPLNAIIGMTELALRSDKPGEVTEHIQTVRKAGSNLLAIVNDILDFSKIESGKIDVVPDNYRVASLIGDIVSIININIRAMERQIHFAVKADSTIPRVLCGDEARLRQVLLNLLSNAVKYTKTGHVSLGVYFDIADNSTLDMIFEVTDTGIGIKAEDSDKLFDDFTQLGAEGKSTGGIGLGLAITQGIVEAMGGDITVQSEYGSGSTFTVTVAQKYSAREAMAKVDSPGEKRVLIYEHRDIYADSVAYALESLGIAHTLVTDAMMLKREMESRLYNYLFISLDMYKAKANEEIISKSGDSTKIIILAELSEKVSDKYPIRLILPAYCVNIAEILNGEAKSSHTPGGSGPAVSFTAPEARVLVVDDININLLVTEGALAPYKMKVDLCQSGEEAINAVKSTRYDLVFMDHKMPGMDGVEATLIIREMGETDTYYKELPIVALTANAVSGMKEMFMENGFDDFLSKPIDNALLDEILVKYLYTTNT